MSRSSRRRLAASLVLLASIAGPGPRAPDASADGAVTVGIDASLDVSATGDRRARVQIAFPAPAYDTVKARNPDPRRFLQDLAPDRADSEMEDMTARYDDARHAVVLEMLERAAARFRGDGTWELEPEPTATLSRIASVSGKPIRAYFTVEGAWTEEVRYKGEYVLTLPPGASDARWNDATKSLTWKLEPAAGEGPPRLVADLRARDRVMSSVYKLYGMGRNLPAFWLAKTVFKNGGKGLARNLKIRYRLQGYGEWSPWEKHAVVAPGQTIVSVHYPVIDASIAKLKTNTPADVLLEYSYEDDAGRRTEDDASKRIVILGVNEFVFGNLAEGRKFGTWQEEYNNAPLLAAWVSRNDGAVKQFAAMANRTAGGVGAGADDASAMRALRACYELLVRNDFTYQHPPALKDRSVSFDPQDVQNVKFPRETMRDRSGTCIDLAILYAAMVHSIGLEPRLALIPGHCFPLVKLPSGRIAGVETTGIGGGSRTGALSFDRVQPIGDQEYAKAQQDGRLYEIDVRALWTSGMANPEMEELPADILERWGISEEGRGGPHPTDATPGPAPGPSGAAESPDKVLGLWGGKIGSKIDGGTLDAFVLGIDRAEKGDGFSAATRADVTLAATATAAERKVVVITRYDGHVKDDGVLFASTERKRTIDGGAAELLVQAFMVVKAVGDHVEARVGNDDEGYTDFTLVRKPDESAAATPSGPLATLVGGWGGEMPHGKIADDLILDEMYVDVGTTLPWKTTVRLEVTVVPKGTSDRVPITLTAEYEGGREDGGAIHFAKSSWHRLVKANGKRDEFDGNALTIKPGPDGKLAGELEGEGGFPFTLLRRTDAPAPPTPPAEPPTPARSSLDDLVGSWGGSLNDAAISKDLSIRDAIVSVTKTASGGWTGSVKFTFVVHTANGDVVVTANGLYPPGRTDGDAIKFPTGKLTRTVASTGATNPMDSNPMELRREPDGRIEVKLVGDGGFTLTLAKR